MGLERIALRGSLPLWICKSMAVRREVAWRGVGHIDMVWKIKGLGPKLTNVCDVSTLKSVSSSYTLWAILSPGLFEMIARDY